MRMTVRHRVVGRALRSYWRMTRSLTMGAQGVVLDPQRRVLLVQHGYRPGWHFPGGGVERNETAATALRRELLEEAGVVLTAPPRLFGVYGNFAAFPSDHIALFLVPHWEQPSIPAPSAEIAASGFFPLTALPPGTVGAVTRRLAEITEGGAPADLW